MFVAHNNLLPNLLMDVINMSKKVDNTFTNPGRQGQRHQVYWCARLKSGNNFDQRLPSAAFDRVVVCKLDLGKKEVP